MDGPSVNLAFLKQLQLELIVKAHSFISIGSCPLHIANNAFKITLTVLKPIIELDLIATDLHFFFKLYAAEREDYKLVKPTTEITTCYMKKHYESRWLSIDRSLVTILEQMPNLHEYFLEHIPQQKGCVCNSSVVPWERLCWRNICSKKEKPYNFRREIDLQKKEAFKVKLNSVLFIHVDALKWSVVLTKLR